MAMINNSLDELTIGKLKSLKPEQIEDLRKNIDTYIAEINARNSNAVNQIALELKEIEYDGIYPSTIAKTELLSVHFGLLGIIDGIKTAFKKIDEREKNKPIDPDLLKSRYDKLLEKIKQEQEGKQNE